MSYSENQTNKLQPRSFENQEVRGFGLNSIIDLYLHPGRFFSEHKLDLDPWYLFATWVVGISFIISRIDRNLTMEAIGASPRPGMGIVMESWAIFWAAVIFSGLLRGVVTRWIGGWFYGIRLTWSGAKHFDRQKARQVLIYSTLVGSMPGVLVTILMMPMFENYAHYWHNSPLRSILIIFSFWSVVTGYQGARTCFNTVRGRSLFWFLLLPMAFYAIIFGVFSLAPIFAA